jgi:DNA-binding transcriptional MocR family regulator
LPAQLLKEASQEVLSDPSIFVPSLQYGPDSGYQPLREELARFLGELYRVPTAAERICISGGASQNLACILQSFTDPVYTLAIWMAAPCYYLACPIFADGGFAGRMKAVAEDEDGIDLSYLERGMLDAEKQNSPHHPVSCALGSWRIS